MAMVEAAGGFERLVINFSRRSTMSKLVLYGKLVNCKITGELVYYGSR